MADSVSLEPFYGELELSGSFDAQQGTLQEAQRWMIFCLYGLRGMPLLNPAETAALLGIQTPEATRLHKLALEAICSRLHTDAWPYASAT